MAQLEIEFETETCMTYALNKLDFGTLFRKLGHSETYMRIKPVGFLNNSNILSDIFARGDCIVVCMNKGTVFPMKGNLEVIKLTGNLKVHRV